MLHLKYMIINNLDQEEIAPHFHSSYELTYYIFGKGYCEYQEKDINPQSQINPTETSHYLPTFQKDVPKKRIDFKTNSCIIFPPYKLHYKNHTENSRFLSLVFDATEQSFVPKLNKYIITSARIQSLFSQIADEYTEKNAYYIKKIECLLTEIFIEINRGEQNHSSVNDFIIQTMRYLDDYFLSDVDFDSYCAANGYSIDYFRHKFKETAKTSPKAYVLEKRLEHACALLRMTNMPIYQIAEICKFSDYSQFSTYFSKKYGISPIKYKKTNK